MSDLFLYLLKRLHLHLLEIRLQDVMSQQCRIKDTIEGLVMDQQILHETIGHIERQKILVKMSTPQRFNRTS